MQVVRYCLQSYDNIYIGVPCDPGVGVSTSEIFRKLQFDQVLTEGSDFLIIGYISDEN